MIIDCISDLHGAFPELEGGDLLIVAGDLTARDNEIGYLRFFEWLTKQSYRKIIFIAGNHDGYLEKYQPTYAYQIQYLRDSSTEFEGLKIWGSPWTPTFCDWHFMKNRGEDIREKWDLIPDDTDILITHGPPWGFRDVPKISLTRKDKHCGCMDLLEAVARVKPKLHVFGHIHGGYGMEEARGTKFVNAAIMTEDYEPLNKPIRIEL